MTISYLDITGSAIAEEIWPLRSLLTQCTPICILQYSHVFCELLVLIVNENPAKLYS